MGRFHFAYCRRILKRRWCHLLQLGRVAKHFIKVKGTKELPWQWLTKVELKRVYASMIEGVG